MRQAQNEFVGMGGTCSCNDFLASRIRFTVGDILCNGAEEEEGFLQNQTDVLAEFGYRDGADINAVNKDGPFGHVIETANQVNQRRFA